MNQKRCIKKLGISIIKINTIEKNLKIYKIGGLKYIKNNLIYNS